jgi:hypothetical protein
LRERGWAAQIEVRVTRHADPLEHGYIEVADRIKVQPWPIFLGRSAIEDIAMTVGQELQEAANFLGKGMFVAVPCSKEPPDFSQRCLGGKGMEHGQHRSCPHSGTQQEAGR